MLVILTKKALSRRKLMLEMIAERHSKETANLIAKRIEDNLRLLSSMPYMWPIVITAKSGTVRKATVDRLTTILYKIKDDHVEVLNITDARSNWK
jgi:plasmid stabilization system protein ParE